ncbi:OmpA family protein [Subsaxibacter sp. CAU 1640]|uniref:OmpA family protein n=1 Tax=Subsaxibacter sp. CAU 1640 TaxID=2933271 RepID=UPI002005431E|nr:OmpA family protein [Subsaxibacter sp. CAU 1640]MCK7588953.1 OmpA family protein [Subsaxibacter sp. CAU 1640]
MKTKLITFIVVAFLGIQANAQLLKKVGDAAQRGVERTVERKVEEKSEKETGKAMDSVLNPNKKDKKKSKKEKSKKSKEDKPIIDNTGNSSAKTVKSNSDFVPGGTVIFSDDFSQDAIGDFPAQWNTNGSGEVVTIDGLNGKWLSVMHNSIINPVMDKALPENSTIEFDLYLQANNQQSTPFIQFGLTPVRDILKEDMFYRNRFFINLHRYSEKDGQTLEYGLKNDVIGNKSDFPLTKYANKVLHVAIAINKTRIRLYLDDNKVIDLPRALTTDMLNNFFLNNNYLIPASEIPMFISNVRIASADVDARSLLIKELMDNGKTSTSDILFDVNSDILKKESFAVIKQFGDALVQNQSLKIKIVGHTDSDGSDADNMELSKKRAAAVKNYITENYAVVGSRIQTEGKGESQPVAQNTSADGKAKNRRVEFIKL